MLSTILAATFACTMPVGYHEFAVFGGDAVFISHYAAFSSIHAFQVVAEVKLSAQAEFIAHQAAHPGVHYTLSPYRNAPVTPERAKDQADWVLPDKLTAGESFYADIHYREAGQDVQVAQNVKVDVAQVVIKTMLDPSAPRPSEAQYVAFGDQGHQYLAHVLSAPPDPGLQVTDFDQIVRVTGVSLPYGATLTATGRANTEAEKLKAGEQVGLIGADGAGAGATVEAEVLGLRVPTER
jgi:hypothetical protein